MGLRALAVLLAALAAGCGGSASETPPPLRPLPPNVHYDRSATTLPGELGLPEREDAGAADEPPDDPNAPADPNKAPGTWGAGKPAPQ